MRHKKSKNKVNKASRKLVKSFIILFTEKKHFKKLKRKFIANLLIWVLVPTPILASWIGLSKGGPKTLIIDIKVIVADTIFYSETSD